MNSFPRFFRAGIGAALTFAAVGCDSGDGWSRVPMQGAVTVPGLAPDEIDGSVILTPADGTDGPSASTAIVDGAFAFDAQTGPVPGPHDALIRLTGMPTATPAGDDLPEGKAISQRGEARLRVEVPAEAPYGADLVWPESS